MRIGIDCRFWNESGVGRYTRNLVKQLQIVDSLNEYVFFVLEKDKERFKIQDLRFKIVVADIRWHTIQEQIRFPSIINNENLDLMHFPYFSVPIFYHKPYVVTIHDLILHHFPTGQASTLPLPIYFAKLFGYKFVISRAAKNAIKILTVSNATKNEIIKHLGIDANKIVVTYEGVDEKISNFKFQISNKSQNTKHQIRNTKYFLYVGNAYPHKNLERLIKAFSLFLDFSPRAQSDIKLVLVGKEDFFYKRLREKVKKMGLTDAVTFFGYATEEELSFLYQHAIALVMPSLMEGFGLPLLEAMANSCVVLASDIPALLEVCSDAAVYFEPLSTQDLSKKMEDVYSDDSNHHSKKIKLGLEIIKKYSWEKMAKETISVYESSISI